MRVGAACVAIMMLLVARPVAMLRIGPLQLGSVLALRVNRCVKPLIMLSLLKVRVPTRAFN